MGDSAPNTVLDRSSRGVWANVRGATTSTREITPPALIFKGFKSRMQSVALKPKLNTKQGQIQASCLVVPLLVPSCTTTLVFLDLQFWDLNPL